MIKQTFYYNNKKILQVYHEDFHDYSSSRDIYKKEQLNEGKVEFRECWIENLGKEESGYDNIFQGFLYANHWKNPYSTLCCNYKELITYDKTTEFIQHKQITNLDEFKSLAEFVKKWCGYDLLKSPFSLNNTLIFKSTGINPEMTLDSTNEKILNLMIPESHHCNLMCIAKFKQTNNIVDTQIITEIDNITAIESIEEWDSVDLELYLDDDLVYAYYDLAFIKSITIDMEFVTRQVNVDLKKSNKTIKLESISSSPIQIGESAIPNELSSYKKQEQLIINQLNAEKRFDFLTKDEYERGLNILEDIASTRGYTEMWLFDPYFISLDIGGGKDRINDIIKVFAKNLNLKKKIVFEISKGSFTSFKDAIKDTVEDLRKKDILLNFTFLGTNVHFHDRFIFLRNEYRMQSFLFGTSFNSFGDNYSTVVELDSENGKIIFETLMNEVANDEYISMHEQLS